jgi:hypothetical protein
MGFYGYPTVQRVATRGNAKGFGRKGPIEKSTNPLKDHAKIANSKMKSI